MPPKGWRKNAEGQYPQPNKDQDFVSIDEILFPASTVQKLAKKIINTNEDGEKESNMLLAKDSSIALQRSATVFVSHLMFHARQISKENSRKTVNAQDILQALERAEFGGFVSEVKQKLTSYEAVVEQKKKQKQSEAITVSNDDNEQLAKRMKNNDNNKVISKHSEDAESTAETEDIADNENIPDEELDTEENDSVFPDDETEQQYENPIAALGKEEQELGGTEQENDPENNDDDSSDDEDN